MPANVLPTAPWLFAGDAVVVTVEIGAVPGVAAVERSVSSRSGLGAAAVVDVLILRPARRRIVGVDGLT
jgi:hypothetical protein